MSTAAAEIEAVAGVDMTHAATASEIVVRERRSRFAMVLHGVENGVLCAALVFMIVLPCWRLR